MGKVRSKLRRLMTNLDSRFKDSHVVLQPKDHHGTAAWPVPTAHSHMICISGRTGTSQENNGEYTCYSLCHLSIPFLAQTEPLFGHLPMDPSLSQIPIAVLV